MVSPTILATIITIIFTVIATLIGLAYKSLRSRISDLEENKETQKHTCNSVVDRVETIWNYLFGLKEDDSDGGLSGDIQDGFDRIESDVEDIKKRQETYHEVEMEHIETLVNKLHDDEDVEVERDDVFNK